MSFEDIEKILEDDLFINKLISDKKMLKENSNWLRINTPNNPRGWNFSQGTVLGETNFHQERRNKLEHNGSCPKGFYMFVVNKINTADSVNINNILTGNTAVAANPIIFNDHGELFIKNVKSFRNPYGGISSLNPPDSHWTNQDKGALFTNLQNGTKRKYPLVDENITFDSSLRFILYKKFNDPLTDNSEDKLCGHPSDLSASAEFNYYILYNPVHRIKFAELYSRAWENTGGNFTSEGIWQAPNTSNNININVKDSNGYNFFPATPSTLSQLSTSPGDAFLWTGEKEITDQNSSLINNFNINNILAKYCSAFIVKSQNGVAKSDGKFRGQNIYSYSDPFCNFFLGTKHFIYNVISQQDFTLESTILNMATADRTFTSGSGYNPFTAAEINNRFTRWGEHSGTSSTRERDEQEIAIYQGYFCKAPSQNPITDDVSWKWIFDYLRRTNGPGNDKANNSFVKLMANMIIAGKTNQNSIKHGTRSNAVELGGISKNQFISNTGGIPIKDRFKWDNITNYPTTGVVDGNTKHSYDLLWPGVNTAAQSNLLTCPSSQIKEVTVAVCNMYSSIISGGGVHTENSDMIQKCKQDFSECTGEGNNFRCSGTPSEPSPGPSSGPSPGSSPGPGPSSGPSPGSSPVPSPVPSPGDSEDDWLNKKYSGLSLWIWLCIIGGFIFLLLILILK